MGTSFNINAMGGIKPHMGSSVTGLIDHLSNCLASVSVLEVRWGKPHSNSSRGQRRKIEELDQPLQELVDHVADSENALCLDLGVAIEAEQVFPLSLCIYGQQNIEGLAAAGKGEVRAACAINLPFRSAPPIPAQPDGSPPTYEQLSDQQDVVWHHDRVFELFEAVCGLHASRDAVWAPHHAVGYLDGLLNPLFASKVFHRRVRDFAQDFDVLKELYEVGGALPLLYSEDIELPEEQLQLLRTPISCDMFRFARGLPNHSPLEFREFFEALDETVVDQLLRLPDEEMAFLIELAAETVSATWRPSSTCSGGAVLIPFFSSDNTKRLGLFDFYRELWELAKDSS